MTQKVTCNEIKIIHEIDSDTDLSYLGEFSNQHGEYPIEHIGEREIYKYFNASNVENMDQAKENYDLMMRYERGSTYDIGIKAIANIQIPIGNNCCINQSIDSGGLWGISIESGKEYIADIEQQQIAEVKTYLDILHVDYSNAKIIPAKE